MIIYTTPTYDLEVVGQNLTTADEVCVTFSDESEAIIVDKDSPTVTREGDNSIVTVRLTQEETSKFIPGTKAQVIVNWLVGSDRLACDIGWVMVKNNLKKEIWNG